MGFCFVKRLFFVFKRIQNVGVVQNIFSWKSVLLKDDSIASIKLSVKGNL